MSQTKCVSSPPPKPDSCRHSIASRNSNLNIVCVSYNFTVEPCFMGHLQCSWSKHLDFRDRIVFFRQGLMVQPVFLSRNLRSWFVPLNEAPLYYIIFTHTNFEILWDWNVIDDWIFSTSKLEISPYRDQYQGW